MMCYVLNIITLLSICGGIYARECTPSALKTKITATFGEVWNDIFFSENFTDIASGKQGRTSVLSPWNPGPFAELQLKATYYEKMFFAVEGEALFIRKGFFTFNQSLQENPFSIKASLSGNLKTDFAGVTLLIGKDFVIKDIFGLGVGFGFAYDKGVRTIDFQNAGVGIIFTDYLTCPAFSLEGSLSPVESCKVTLGYGLIAGNLRANIKRIPTNEMIYYFFPGFFISKLKVFAEYIIDNYWTIGLHTAFVVAQIFKNGRVSLPIADQSLFSNNKVTALRSQFFAIGLSLNYIY